jgi:hypothetical protein
MVTAQQYLEGILEKYNLTEQQIEPIKKKRETIENFFRTKYGSKIATFYYSGSYAKGTAINLKYDLDLCIYFRRDAFSTLKEMYYDVYNALRQNYIVNLQTVSMGLVSGNESIDIVPARKIDDSTDYANLYDNDHNGQIQTNIPKHKEYISISEARPIIKLMKVWKFQHSIHFKSFGLELLTIRALENFNDPDYGNRVLQVLRFFRDNAKSIRLIDPANSNNIISDLIAPVDKQAIADNAYASLQKKYLNEIIW